MPKIIKNTTASDVFVVSVGRNIPANSQVTLEVREYLIWASDAAISEISPKIQSGDLIVNDGHNDLPPDRGIDFLRYPDTAFNVRFLSPPERANSFTAKTVQEAIEEAVSGTTPVSKTTTVGSETKVAFTLPVQDGSANIVDARVIARRTDVLGDYADFQIVCKVARENGGNATIVGHVFQKKAQKTLSGLDVNWEVNGSNLELKVTGVTGATIDWQPQVEREVVVT